MVICIDCDGTFCEWFKYFLSITLLIGIRHCTIWKCSDAFGTKRKQCRFLIKIIAWDHDFFKHCRFENCELKSLYCVLISCLISLMISVANL